MLDESVTTRILDARTIHARRTRRSRSVLAVASLVVLPLGGCAGDDDGDGVRGSGTVTTEERAVGGFDRVLLEGSGELIVEVGGQETLELEAEDNLLPLLTSDVRGSTLELGTSESISPTRPIVYDIGAASLDGLTITGSGDVVVRDLDCDGLEIDVSGVGRFDLAGSCDLLDVSITGTGELDALDLTVASAEVEIAGSGDVVLNASDALDVLISGSGSVEYVGDPETSIDIRGTGTVRRRP